MQSPFRGSDHKMSVQAMELKHYCWCSLPYMADTFERSESVSSCRGKALEAMPGMMLHIHLHLYLSPEMKVLVLNTQETWLLFSHPSLPWLEITLLLLLHVSQGSSMLHGSAHLQSSQDNATPQRRKHHACPEPLSFTGIF